uniref:Ionotropic receptor 11 n=1 Tax=Propsilocerus akamusi TaxID=903466 RepID=A0A7D0P9Q9_9DIPT|nr:ionotropic receptor 11 [Propsilocerus akamusi]
MPKFSFLEALFSLLLFLFFYILSVFAESLKYFENFSGAIFREDQRGTTTDLSFKFAVHKINEDRRLLPKTTLVYDIQYVDKHDSFHTHTQDIPLIQTHLGIDDERNREFSINLFPAQTILNDAIFEVVNFLNWTRAALIYEQNYGVVNLKTLNRDLKAPDVDIFLKATDENSYHAVLQELKDKEIYNLIVDTNPHYMNSFLKAILELQMNDFKFHYFFTSFDIELFEMEDLKYNFVNITAFRLVDTNDVFVKETLKEMEQYSNLHHDVNFERNLAIETEVTLIYDSVFVFAIGLQTLQHSTELKISSANCKDERTSLIGSSLLNFINTVEFKGISGQIEFKEGQRTAFKLDLVKLKHHNIVKCGEWGPTRLNITDYDSLFEANQMNVTLVVVTILQVPYVMISKSKNLTGNARFYGFCVDLLEKISHEVGFNYILDLVHDRKYGAKDAITGEWNGMVGVLMKHKADLAVASLTINYARESVIDFSSPFMNLGISILFKVPETQETKLFSFLNPLAVEIWICVFFAYCLVSLTVWIVARFSEWAAASRCNQNSGLYENHFTLSNSFWFVIGTLMQQGSDLNPKATSTRIVGGIWWFFTLIIISSYTANLAAFLTVERMITPIENVDDLATQTDIAYGTLESGSTMTFFRDSMIETYKKMWRFMENKKPSVFVSTYEEGMKRVLEGNYAFLMESTMLDYSVQRNCNLTQIGGLLDTKGYGIALPKGSIWRDKISLAILELQEKGEIQMLYDKWWKNTGEICSRDEKQKDTKANALGVDNIGGVFVVLLCGLAFAVLIAIIEFCYKSKKDNFTDPLYLLQTKNSLCAEMTEELRFALSCSGSRQRPTLKKNFCNECRNSNNLFLKSQSNMINDVNY